MARVTIPWMPIAVASMAVVLGCTSSSDSRRSGSGVITPPGQACLMGGAGCGQMCGGSSGACPAGLYCGPNNACTKDCDQGKLCLDGQMCLTNGRCPRPLPGANPQGTATGAMGFDGGRVGTGSPGAPGQCHAVAVNATHVAPIVVAIVDQSGSMGDPLSENINRTRWDILRNELVGPVMLAHPNMPVNRSLFNEFASTVQFALQMYTDDRYTDGCPDLVWMPPQINQYLPLHDEYVKHSPSGSTPTAEALRDSIEKMMMLGYIGAFGPDVMQHPVLFLLATDGAPHSCLLNLPRCDPNPMPPLVPVLPTPTEPCRCGWGATQGPPGCTMVEEPNTTEVETEVERAFSLGITTFVIELAGPDDPRRTAHLKRVANIGAGLPAGNPRPKNYFNPLHDAALRKALHGIVGNAVTCQIKLDGTVVSQNPCEGTVILNGQMLTCNDPNGWVLTGPSTVTVNGTACDTLKKGGAVVDVSFPCGAVLL